VRTEQIGTAAVAIPKAFGLEAATRLPPFSPAGMKVPEGLPANSIRLGWTEPPRLQVLRQLGAEELTPDFVRDEPAAAG
jgi:hypothetical protein